MSEKKRALPRQVRDPVNITVCRRYRQKTYRQCNEKALDGMRIKK